MVAMDEHHLLEPDVIGPPPRRWTWVVGVILALVVPAGTVGAMATVLKVTGLAPKVLSVDQLDAHYRAHRSAFAALVPLASSGSGSVIDVKMHAVHAPGISQADVASAQTVLRSIDAERAEADEGELYVEMGSDGLAVSGVSWGYCYCMIPPSQTVTLEVARSKDAPEIWFCPLGDGWYATVDRF